MLDLSRIEAVLSSDSDDFKALVQAAGLDPKSDFRAANLAGLRLSGADLRGFDLSMADLRGTRLREAIIDRTTILRGAQLDQDDVPIVDALRKAPNEPSVDDFIRWMKEAVELMVADEYSKADDIFASAERHARQECRAKDFWLPLLASALEMRSLIRIHLNETDLALPMLMEAVDRHKAAKLTLDKKRLWMPSEARCRHKIGLIHSERGDVDQAIIWMRSADKMYRRFDIVKLDVIADEYLKNSIALSGCLVQKSQYRNAYKILMRAEERARRVKDFSAGFNIVRAHLHYEVGRLAIKLSSSDDALKFLELSLNEIESDQAEDQDQLTRACKISSVHDSIGDALMQKGNVEEALRHYTEGLAALAWTEGTEHDNSRTTLYISTSYDRIAFAHVRLKNIEEASRILEKSLRKLREHYTGGSTSLDIIDSMIRDCLNLANLKRKRNETKLRQEYIRFAIDLAQECIDLEDSDAETLVLFSRTMMSLAQIDNRNKLRYVEGLQKEIAKFKNQVLLSHKGDSNLRKVEAIIAGKRLSIRS